MTHLLSVPSVPDRAPGRTRHTGADSVSAPSVPEGVIGGVEYHSGKTFTCSQE
jgi:hypothetical protein